jgi:tellurite methyltransferase
MDLEFWENYYKSADFVTKESPFAEFCISNFDIKGNLIELGCGNGRDAAFFASHGIDVIGIDQCHNAIERLNELRIPKAIFKVADFTNLLDTEQYDNIYSRFTLHSVEEEAQERVISWASKVLNNGFFGIEVRSVNDSLFGKGSPGGRNIWITDHARRFVEIKDLRNSLITNGFQIIYELESNGLAIYKNEDPVVIRIVAKIKR